MLASLLFLCSWPVGTSPARSSPLLGFLKLVVAQKEGARRKKFSRERNKWYQSISGSSWDRVSILKQRLDCSRNQIRRSRSLQKLFKIFALGKDPIFI